MAIGGGSFTSFTTTVPPEGDGRDGDYHLKKGVATPTNYFLPRELQFRNLTVDADVSLKLLASGSPNTTTPFILRVSNIVTLNGTIEADGVNGNNAVSGIGGAGGNGGKGFGADGGAGGTGFAAGGNNGSTHGNGGRGGGGVGGGGLGGDGGNGELSETRQGASGGGGGGVLPAGTAAGGGGGGGGGLIQVICNVLKGLGKLTSKGGNGGSAVADGASAGGGGGGAGGRVIVHYRNASNWTGTIDVSGGDGGAGAGGGTGGVGGGAGEAITASLNTISNPGTAGASTDIKSGAPDDWLYSTSEYNKLHGGLATEDRTMDVILLHPECIRYLQEHGSEIIEHDYACPKCGHVHNIKLVWREDLG